MAVWDKTHIAFIYISARSKWTADQGYSSKRQCKSFIFDKEDGLTDIIYTPIKV